MSKILEIFIDGACQPNPGKGGIGIFIKSSDFQEKHSYTLKDEVTNNIAEYEALIKCLNFIKNKFMKFDEIVIYTDSKLVCMQFNKFWKCKDLKLQQLLNNAHLIYSEINVNIKLKHIPRELNTEADALAKSAINN